MQAMTQLYHTTFSDILKPYGFRYIHGCFARVYGEIIQSVRLHIFQGKKRCTIYFALIPLCQKIDYFDVGLYNLRAFTLPPTWQQGDAWVFEQNEASVMACIAEIRECVERNLLPLLKKCSTCQETLTALLDLEALFYQNRCTARCIWGKEEWIKALGNGINLVDGRKYYMALKAGNFSKAAEMMRAFLTMNLYPPQTEETAAAELKRTNIVAKEQEELAHLEAKDSAYFAPILAENEAYTTNVLKKYGLLR